MEPVVKQPMVTTVEGPTTELDLKQIERIDDEILPCIEMLHQMHRDVSNMYRVHKSRLQQLWGEMDPSQREGMLDYVDDHIAPVVYMSFPPIDGEYLDLVPEWRIEDIAAAGSNHLLHIIDSRATASLQEQYLGCDYGYAIEIMSTPSLLPTEINPHWYIVFGPGDEYGWCIGRGANVKKDEFEAFLRAEYGAGFVLPSYIAEIIIKRQFRLLKSIEMVVTFILQPLNRELTTIPTKSNRNDIGRLISTLSTPGINLPALREMAQYLKSVLDEYLHLVYTEPTLLSELFSSWHHSYPHHIADEHGLNVETNDDYYWLITHAFIDMMHDTVGRAAIWNYMHQLLALVESSDNKDHQRIILQEVVNLCYLEYQRAYDFFERQLSRGRGLDCFTRVPDESDHAYVQLKLKDKPTVLAHHSPAFCSLLSLCERISALERVELMRGLQVKLELQPLELNALNKWEVEAIDDLSVIGAFLSSLPGAVQTSAAIRMPDFSFKEGQRFPSGIRALARELEDMKPFLDIPRFADVTENLLDARNAAAALKHFDKTLVYAKGKDLRFLHEDLVNDCITELNKQLVENQLAESQLVENQLAENQLAENQVVENQLAEKQLAAQAGKGIRKGKKQAGQKTKTESEYIPFPPEPPKAPEVRVQERRQKEKTRPAHSSVYDIVPSDSNANAVTPASPKSPEPFKVKVSTAEIFSTLFDRKESRGPVSWANFEAALAELGFSVVPKSGSAYTFFPPKSMAIQKPFTVHRPHGPHIEGHTLLMFSRRLNETYGWDKDTFEIA
ncbi:hypothetical protein F4802DRAFT_612205 [Xylaria palmicola]|nr:hypothetical protein F4802DRAFT_612205 [Xylaria palmicola]